MTNGPTLTSNDSAVLSQLFDPESAPTSGVLVDASLSTDPHIHDTQVLSRIKKQEGEIIREVEACLKNPQPSVTREEILQQAHDKLSVLVEKFPNCASLLNNRAQLFRLQYGDNVLVLQSLTEVLIRASVALTDLTTAIRLLSPRTPQAAISPTQCKTLAQAHTQRGALYHAASKALTLIGSKEISASSGMNASVKSVEGWSILDFEEAASRDFFMGGRYGNEIGKALAVHTNPTAKLCGQMVQEAMKREFAPASSAPL